MGACKEWTWHVCRRDGARVRMQQAVRRAWMRSELQVRKGQASMWGASHACALGAYADVVKLVSRGALRHRGIRAKKSDAAAGSLHAHRAHVCSKQALRAWTAGCGVGG